MTAPRYGPARAVAAAAAGHFARHLAGAREEGRSDLAPVPDAATIEALVEVGFWASLRREEGLSPKISLAYLPPEAVEAPLRLGRSLPLHPAPLARLAPAVERPGIHLGVWHEDGELRVWGTTHSVPCLCLVLEVAEPGLLVIKAGREQEFAKYTNVAVVEGDQVKMVDERAASLPDCPELLSSLLGFESPAAWGDSVHVLVQLAVSMRAHRHGGILLVVPERAGRWEESIVRPITYPVEPPFTELARLARSAPVAVRDNWWKEEFRRAIDRLAGLTAVDGATVISAGYELLAFGAKIGRREGSPPVERVSISEPIVGGLTGVVHPTQLGGTRHLSAAQFIHDQHDAVALVASQDGRFTVFAWSPCEGLVHAHRVEALLL